MQFPDPAARKHDDTALHCVKEAISETATSGDTKTHTFGRAPLEELEY